MSISPKKWDLLPTLLCAVSTAATGQTHATVDEVVAPTSCDLRVSQHPDSNKDHVCLDVDEAGRATVVWQSRRQQAGTYGIYARRFGTDGSPLTNEVQVNATTTSHQTAPSVALDADGTAWIAWVSHAQDGSLGTIVARRFDADLGTASAEIIVNENFSGDQRDVCIVSDHKGSAVAIWTTPREEGSGRTLRGRRLAADGTAQGPSFEVESTREGSAHTPSLTMTADGAFIAAWARTSADGTPVAILGRHFDAEGAGGEVFQISPEDRTAGIEPSVAAIDERKFVVAWLESHQQSYRLVHRRFELDDESLAQGAKVELLPRKESGYVSGVSTAARASGEVAFAWNHFGESPSQSDLYLATFDQDGAPLREAFVATERRAGHQHLTQADGSQMLIYGSDGRLVVAWSGDAGLGDHKAAHLSMHAAPGSQLIASTGLTDPPRQFEEPAQPHTPPSFQPVTDLTPIDRNPQHHALTGMVGFDGGSSTGWTPPDPDLAVGPNHLVQMTNGRIAFFQKNGSMDFTDQIEGSSGFWGNQGAAGFVFDPEVRWDPHTQRFFAMANERDGDEPYFLLAVSDDDNPNGSWAKYRINVQAAAGDTDIDSPNMGIDEEAVYLTADFFGPTKFLVYVIEKAPLLSGGPVNANSVVLTGQQSLGVPVTYDTSTRQYMIWSPESGTSNSIEVFAINNPLSNPSLVSTTVTVPNFTQPEDPPQQGTSTRPQTFESRFWSCIYRDGSLWATHHVNSNRVRQRWYQIDMADWPVSGTPTLVQSGEIDPGAGVRTYFGSIAVDAFGNMGMTFARSSSSEFISMGYTWREANDPLGTTRPMVIARDSNSADNSGRWGDYSGIGPDPNELGKFWATHEYRTSGWKTWIQSFFAVESISNYCSTSPNSAGPGASISASGSTSIAANDLVLEILGAPPSVQGLFFFGFSEDAVLFGNGLRCVGAPLQRLPVSPSDVLGTVSFPLDQNSPQVGGSITAGMAGKFQYWYRDQGVGANFNLSDGLSVIFAP